MVEGSKADAAAGILAYPAATHLPAIATLVMLTAIGFLAVITAAVTASLVESGRRQFAASPEGDIARRLDEVTERLARIESALNRQGPESDV